MGTPKPLKPQPCPWCDHEAEVIALCGNRPWFSCGCAGCDAAGPSIQSQPGAVRAWNCITLRGEDE